MNQANLKSIVKIWHSDVISGIDAILSDIIPKCDTARDDDAYIQLKEDITQYGERETKKRIAYSLFIRIIAICMMEKRRLVLPLIENTINQYSSKEDTLDFFKKVVFQEIPLIDNVFGRPIPYIKLLIPECIIEHEGFIGLLIDKSLISDGDWQKEELIGWFHMFYQLHEKRSDGDDSTAVEIFTPEWYVKYMVVNTVGRIAIDSGLCKNLSNEYQRYLVREDDVSKRELMKVESPKDISVLDLACGSGNILLESFRLLIQIYQLSGYTEAQSIENIIHHNLVGFDIDNRLRKVCLFSILLLAATVNREYCDAKLFPNIFGTTDLLSRDDWNIGEVSNLLHIRDLSLLDEIDYDFNMLSKFDVLGSTVKLKASDELHTIIQETIKSIECKSHDDITDIEYKYLPSLRVIKALTDRYCCVIMNPPYTGIAKIRDKQLTAYMHKEYPDADSDLFSVFMEISFDRNKKGGRIGMITPQSWMFLSSFETLRKKILETKTILSMLHLGANSFDSLSGGGLLQTTTFVLGNKFIEGYPSLFIRLTEGKSEEEKKQMFFEIQKEIEENAG